MQPQKVGLSVFHEVWHENGMLAHGIEE